MAHPTIATAHRQAALIVVALATLACIQQPQLVVQNSDGDFVPLEPWMATLAAVPIDREAGDSAVGAYARPSGTVVLSPMTVQETRATITLEGGEPRAEYPWYVQLGQCGNDRGILAGPLAYPPVEVDDDGRGSAVVMLPFTVPTSGRFFVSVRRSETEIATTVACGNLARQRQVAQH